MQRYRCKYGFACTLTQSVFVKRPGTYRFAVSCIVSTIDLFEEYPTHNEL